MLDPALIDNTIPLALEVIRRVRNDGIKGIPIHFIFVNGVDCINKSHKLTARLYGTGVTLGKERSLAYEGLDFTIDHLIGIRAPGRIKQGATYLSITPIENDFDLSRVADLMKLLRNRTKKTLQNCLVSICVLKIFCKTMMSSAP